MDIRWKGLSNPYLNSIDTATVINGHISGRSEDIASIINGAQSAILLSGAPQIGKSTLIRYLQLPPTSAWSWRNELAPLLQDFNLDRIFFTTVDLAPLENIEDEDQLLKFFIRRCNAALQLFNPAGEQEPSDALRDLYKLIRAICREMPEGRFFLMFDTFERLEQSGLKLFERFESTSASGAKTPQERSIALLDHSGAIHMLVDLMEENSNFGVIFSINTLPRPKIVDQFSHVSADLARFTLMTLQAFTWDDTLAFLRQPPEDFDGKWARQFNSLGGTTIFSEEEQQWISTLAGTHPYLLQQCCFYTFQLKQEYAQLHDHWTALRPEGEKQLREVLNERLSTSLKRLWRRLQEAVENVSPEIRNQFYEFIRSLASRSAQDEIGMDEWLELDSELRYILQNEGLVRYDPFQPVHYPGAIVCRYLAQRLAESSPNPQRGYWLTITRPGSQREQISLSELEYRLLKTLIQHPKRCSEEELMKGAWGKTIDKPAFAQRMHQLRKKLRDRYQGTEVIENHYGGYYSLTNPDWLYLE